MARGLIRGYHAMWSHLSWQAVSVEQEFVCNIRDLRRNGGPRHHTFNMAGKKDVNVLRDRERWVLDHKTTSSDVGVDSPMWDQLDIEGQVDLYLLSEWYLGAKAEGATWDMLKKPGIKPKALSEKARAEITSLGTYCLFDVSDSSKEMALTKGVKENAELYEYRVARDCIDNGPKYFAHREIIRGQSDLVAYAKTLWKTATEIGRVRRSGCHLQNYTACMNYGRACGFLGLCSGMDNPDSHYWQPRKCVHSELDSIDGDGKDTLTASRIACFLTCRRKHYYRYELGIERVAYADESEALMFGNLIHTALEAWWKTRLIQPKEVTNGGNI